VAAVGDVGRGPSTRAAAALTRVSVSRNDAIDALKLSRSGWVFGANSVEMS
jgi:S-adenosylhomocysteine hydrolase